MKRALRPVVDGKREFNGMTPLCWFVTTRVQVNSRTDLAKTTRASMLLARSAHDKRAVNYHGCVLPHHSALTEFEGYDQLQHEPYE